MTSFHVAAGTFCLSDVCAAGNRFTYKHVQSTQMQVLAYSCCERSFVRLGSVASSSSSAIPKGHLSIFFFFFFRENNKFAGSTLTPTDVVYRQVMTQSSISVWPLHGLNTRPAIITHFKDVTQSKTAFIHLFWQTPSTPLLFCLLTFPPSNPPAEFFFLFSHQPSSLFRWTIKWRNKCKRSLVWHTALLTHSALKYLPARLPSHHLNLALGGCRQRWGEVCQNRGALVLGTETVRCPLLTPPRYSRSRNKTPKSRGSRTCFTSSHLLYTSY